MSLRHQLVYILGAPRRRWRNETNAVYLLEMSLTGQPNPERCRVEKKTHWDKAVQEFVERRESEDDLWAGKSYAAEVRARFFSGDWCYLEYLEGEEIGCIFASHGTCSVKPVHYRLHLPPGVVALYDVYTAPKYRGHGFYSCLFRAATRECLEQGFHTAWVWIMTHNQTSFKVHARLGLRHVIGQITERQRWGIRWRWRELLDMDVETLLRGL